MTTMTLQTTQQPVYLDTAIGTPPRDLVWRSSSLVDLYLARLRDALPMHHPQIEIMTRLVASCLLYTSPSPRDRQKSRMPSSA